MKTILISGTSSGIGRHCAIALADAGFKVLAGVRRREDGVELEKLGSGRIEPVLLDVTDQASIRQAVERAGSWELHGLVNNAGVTQLGPLEFVGVDRIRRQFEVNFFGQIAMMQAFLPLLRKTTGRIINISSISGRVAFPFAGPYAASKFALEAASDSLRRELRPWNIKVCLIEPGNIQTPLWEKTSSTSQEAAGQFPPAAQEYYLNWLMSSRYKRKFPNDPSGVAQAVLRALTAKNPRARYLVGRDARFYALLGRWLPDWLLDRVL